MATDEASEELLRADAYAAAIGEPHDAVDAQRVVHVVGRLTDSVHRLVGPATEALGQARAIRQVVVLLEDPQHPELVAAFDRRVKRIVIRHGRNPIARWQRWLRAVRYALAGQSADAVHLHGFLPALLALPIVHRCAPRRLLFSPHDARTQAARFVFRLATWLHRPTPRRVEGVAVVALPSETLVFGSAPGWRTTAVSVPVARPYFLARRAPAPRPLVVGGVFDAPATTASRFVQVAVLMGPGESDASFSWLGAAWGRARDELEAASVAIFDERDAAARAEHLATAWVYLCPASTRGFPGHLVEALACGLPVVAVDSPLHRDIVRDGETGFLCADDAGLITCVTRLLQDEALRRRMGDAARRDAWRQFGGSPFKSAVLRAYSPDAYAAISG